MSIARVPELLQRSCIPSMSPKTAPKLQKMMECHSSWIFIQMMVKAAQHIPMNGFGFNDYIQYWYVACNIMIVNEASRVISEWCHNLEHHLQSSIALLELSNMLLGSSTKLLESSIMFLESINNAGVTHDNDHMTILMCLQYRPPDSEQAKGK
jgi:hypothetical protein